jgi:hypothetical protein
MPFLARDDHRRAQRIRDMPAERVLQEVVQVVGPADGGGAAGQPVFQQQAGGDDEGGELAHGGVGEGIRGAGRRHAVRQFGVAQRRQAGGDGRQQERQHDRRAGLRHRFDHGEEDAGADGGADADHGQREQAERTVQADTSKLAGTRVMAILALALQGLGSQQLLAQCLLHGVSSGRTSKACDYRASCNPYIRYHQQCSEKIITLNLH